MRSDKINHRGLELLQALERLGGSARSSDLVEVLEVSGETVRRTIAGLAESGHVRRVHGGVLLQRPEVEGGDFVSRLGENAREKRAVARRVAEEIEDGMTLFLDVSTTTSFVVESLGRLSQLTVVTNALGIGQALANRNDNRVHLLGGEVSGRDNGTFGALTQAQAARFAYDLAVFGVDGVSAEQGYLYYSEPEAAMAEVVAASAGRVVVGITQDKFSRAAPYKGMAPTQVDLLVADGEAPAELEAQLALWGTGFAAAFAPQI